MKFYLIFYFLSIVLTFINCDVRLETENYSNLAKGVNQIINKMYAEFSKSINIIYDEKSDISLFDFKDDLFGLFLQTPQVVFRQESKRFLNANVKRKRRISVLLISEIREFSSIYAELSSNLFQSNGLIAIILVGGKINEIEDIFKQLWKDQVFNVIVVFEDLHEMICVQTFMPFNDAKCDDTTPVTITQFSVGNISENLNLFPKKMENLHGCQVRISTSNTTEPFIFATLLSNGSFDLKGSDITFLNTLAMSLNFTINYTFIGEEGYFFDDMSEGPLRVLLDGVSDMSLVNWWLKPNRMKKFDFTSPYLVDRIVLIVPPGRDYTTLEKLAYPFSIPSWTLILICFIIGIIVIFTVKHQTMTVQNFIIGEGVKNPYLNMFIGVVGGTQHILPKRNFARFLLMVFLMYSLVMRTLYQGSSYKLLQSNKHKLEIQTIDELIEKDFAFYLYPGVSDVFNGVEEIKNRFVFTFSTPKIVT